MSDEDRATTTGNRQTDRQTDTHTLTHTQTDHATPSVAIGRI